MNDTPKDDAAPTPPPTPQPPFLTPAPSPIPTPAGLLIIDKPLRRSSMDVCRIVRRKLVLAGAPKRVKVGHGGTLDPLATGLLVILVGKATPLCNKIMTEAKSYLTEIDLSAFSTTDDAEGERTEVAVAEPPTLEQVESVCRNFVGVISQRPPAFSAMKIGGQRAYALARRGEEVVLAARPVRIDAITILEYAYPRLRLNIDCGKGTYIRALGRDIGTALGTGGTIAALRRTRTGPFVIEQAKTVAELPDVLRQGDLLAIPNELA